MKKILAIILAVALCFSMSAAAFAADDTMLISSNPNADTTVYVTIVDAGTLKIVQKPVSVTDADEDGALTINDALILAHSKYYADGANGYVTYKGDYGLAISKLWGVENGGSYMYYLNDIMPLSLTDTVKNNDRLTAYGFADLEGWSDVYTFFDKTEAKAAAGDTLELVLKGYDWSLDPNGGASPIAGAEIYVNGTATGVLTDENGKAAVKLDNAGIFTVSAKSATSTLTPPVCTATVSFTDVKADDSFAEAVNYLIAEDLLREFAGAKFEPATDASRAMIISMLHRGEGQPSVPADANVENFTDAEAYFEAFRWAAYEGIIEGYGNGKAGPLDGLTREQMAAIIWRYAKSKGADVSVGEDTNILSYNDALEISDWAMSAMQWACGSALIKGDADGNIRPDAVVTRAELAQCIYKISAIIG